MRKAYALAEDVHDDVCLEVPGASECIEAVVDRANGLWERHED